MAGRRRRRLQASEVSPPGFRRPGVAMDTRCQRAFSLFGAMAMDITNPPLYKAIHTCPCIPWARHPINTDPGTALSAERLAAGSDSSLPGPAAAKTPRTRRGPTYVLTTAGSRLRGTSQPRRSMLRQAVGAGLRASRPLKGLLLQQAAVQPAWAAAAFQLHRADAARVRAFAASPGAPAPVPQSKMADSHLNGASAAYLEELESRFRENPDSVDKTWANFFRLIGEPRLLAGWRWRLAAAANEGGFLASFVTRNTPLADAGKTPEALSEAYSAFSKGTMPAVASAPLATGQTLTQEAIQKSMRILLLVRAYQASAPLRGTIGRLFLCGLRRLARAPGGIFRATNPPEAPAWDPLQVNGHYLANLDPLGLDHRPPPIELDPALYGFTEADLDKECGPPPARARAAPPRAPPCITRTAPRRSAPPPSRLALLPLPPPLLLPPPSRRQTPFSLPSGSSSAPGTCAASSPRTARSRRSARSSSG